MPTRKRKELTVGELRRLCDQAGDDTLVVMVFDGFGFVPACGETSGLGYVGVPDEDDDPDPYLPPKEDNIPVFSVHPVGFYVEEGEEDGIDPTMN